MIDLDRELAGFVPKFPINFSRLKWMAISPLHFAWACLSREWDDDDAEKPPYLRSGSASHCLTLEPENFADRFVVYPKRRQGKAFEAFKAEHEGLTILSTKEIEAAQGIANGIRRSRAVRRILMQPKAHVEKRIYWRDKETGIDLAGTPDVRGVDLGDLKGSGLKPHRFVSWAVDAGYPSQLAMYGDGSEAIGHEIRDSYLLYVESSQPHDSFPYHLGNDALDYGRRTYRGWLRKLATCLESGQWPGRASEPVPFVLPGWAAAPQTPVTLEIGGEEIHV